MGPGRGRRRCQEPQKRQPRGAATHFPGGQCDPISSRISNSLITPPEIAELLEAWPEIDPGTARLIRAAVISSDSRRMRRAWDMLFARAELVQMVR